MNIWTNKKIENHLMQLLINNCFYDLNLNSSSITISKFEKPDFIIGDCKQTIGVEITRALDENMAKVDSVREKNFPNISLAPIEFENKKMSSKEIKKRLTKISDTNQIISRAYMGNELEVKVANDIIKAIGKKLIKFNNYKKFDRNILMVHSETRPSLDINDVIIQLGEYIFSTDMLFDYIFLKLGSKIYCFHNYSVNYYNLSRS